MSTEAAALIVPALAAWCSNLRLADVPAPVRAIAKHCLIDTLGVALAGSRTQVARYAAQVQELSAAAGHSTLLGRPGGLTPGAAAFANAVAGHALDFDDNSYAGFVHASVIIAPAALAMAQMLDMDGRGLLSAFIAGAECEYALAKVLTREIYDRGWWTSSVLGAIGACAAACHALALDTEQTAAAFGIALAGAGGMKAAFGTDAKALMAGHTAAYGVNCALLASRGCSGPLDVVEHPRGLAALFAGGALQPLPSGGWQWGLLDPGVDFKRIPLCLSSHAAVEVVRGLSPDAASVAQIICDVPPIVMQNLPHQQPSTAQQAQFSMPFAIASACLWGDIGLAHLNYLHNPPLRVLMARVRMTSSARWTEALLAQAPEGAWVSVQLQDGSTREGFCAAALGSAARPLSRAQRLDKFTQCASATLPLEDAQALFDTLEHLEQVRCLRTLMTPEHSARQVCA